MIDDKVQAVLDKTRKREAQKEKKNRKLTLKYILLSLCVWVIALIFILRVFIPNLIEMGKTFEKKNAMSHAPMMVRIDIQDCDGLETKPECYLDDRIYKAHMGSGKEYWHEANLAEFPYLRYDEDTSTTSKAIFQYGSRFTMKTAPSGWNIIIVKTENIGTKDYPVAENRVYNDIIPYTDVNKPFIMGDKGHYYRVMIIRDKDQ